MNIAHLKNKNQGKLKNVKQTEEDEEHNDQP